MVQSYEASRLVAYGESLGTGVAVRLASKQLLAGLILDAPYTSTADVASLTYWYVPVSWLMLDQFRSLDIIQSVKAPILILHGTDDGTIPCLWRTAVCSRSRAKALHPYRGREPQQELGAGWADSGGGFPRGD